MRAARSQRHPVGASAADGIVHTAFGRGLSKIVELAKEDREAVETFGELFAGSDRPIVATSGVLLMTPGETFMEHARPPIIPTSRVRPSRPRCGCRARAAGSTVVRNPRSVHGAGERHGFVPMLAALARQKGISADVGEGQNKSAKWKS